MRIYISAGKLPQEDTDKIARFLEKHGHIVYYSSKDKFKNVPAKEIFLNNIVQIRNSDVFIAYFTKEGNYEVDTAVEVGIAFEAGKQIILYLELDKNDLDSFYKNLEENIMFSSSFSGIFTDLEKFANYLLSI